jgi:uncharacterized protein (TIGR02588 family)
MAARTRKQNQRRNDNERAAPNSSRSGSPGNTQEAQAIPSLEWIIGAIGFVMIAGVLGILLYTGMSDDHPLPDVKLSVDGISRVRNGYVVRVTATNEGGLTAEGVILEGELRNGTDLIERSQTEIAFLPSRSKKRAGLFFSRDPNQFELKVRPHGYEEP